MRTLSKAAAVLVARGKPLFIPLKTEHFEKFERGEKHSEFRLYGVRWNEKTCYAGRLATLSKGYGPKHRLHKVVEGFTLHNARLLDDYHRAAILDCFGTLDKPVIEILLADAMPGFL